MCFGVSRCTSTNAMSPRPLKIPRLRQWSTIGVWLSAHQDLCPEMVNPVFGHARYNRGVTRFHRRGRKAVRTEWRLQMMTHNLTKLHRHQMANNAEPRTATTNAVLLPAPSHTSDRRLV
jgi:hypothetical protein